MQFIDEYRDPALARRLIEELERQARSIGREVTIMEVCGSHTNAIGRYGIRTVLPANVRLISGPGCPVCVTAIQDVDYALALAGCEGVILATFGDMLRVPGSGGMSLQRLRAQGADIRVVASASDCLGLAAQNPRRQVVFLGIGFETTAPTVASLVRRARRQGLANLSVFAVHKLIPPAIKALLDDEDIGLDAFLCPGHVSTIIGEAAYAAIPQRGLAAVIAGFEPVDILEGLCLILGQVGRGEFAVENQYARGVAPGGNPKARALMEEVFVPEDALWRGLGAIAASGLGFRKEYAAFDARARFDLAAVISQEPAGCRCGAILTGRLAPPDCPLFARACTPVNPVGPCMVSSEGTCGAYYRYHQREGHA